MKRDRNAVLWVRIARRVSRPLGQSQAVAICKPTVCVLQAHCKTPPQGPSWHLPHAQVKVQASEACMRALAATKKMKICVWRGNISPYSMCTNLRHIVRNGVINCIALDSISIHPYIRCHKKVKWPRWSFGKRWMTAHSIIKNECTWPLLVAVTAEADSFNGPQSCQKQWGRNIYISKLVWRELLYSIGSGIKHLRNVIPLSITLDLSSYPVNPS